MNNLYNMIMFSADVIYDRGSSISNWQTEYGVPEAQLFYIPMRAMVQEYTMGGAFVNMTISDMIFGFESKVAHKVNGGDFLWGNVFALQSPITPIFNDQVGTMSEQQMSFYPGTSEPKNAGIIKWQNGQTELNRIMTVFNGVNNFTVYKNLENELEASQTFYFNKTYTNGMQFMPKIFNDVQDLNVLNVFDQGNLMLVSYENSTRNTSGAVNTLRYKITQPFNGLNVSLAYDQKYQLYGQYCYGCDTTTRMDSVLIDNQSIEHWRE